MVFSSVASRGRSLVRHRELADAPREIRARRAAHVAGAIVKRDIDPPVPLRASNAQADRGAACLRRSAAAGRDAACVVNRARQRDLLGAAKLGIDLPQRCEVAADGEVRILLGTLWK